MLDMTSLLISSAQAQAAQPAANAAQASPLAGLAPFLLILVVFYFLIIRPQSKRYKEHAAMVKGLKRGDRVLTGGGIIGKVAKADEGSDIIQVEIASGVVVEVSRSTITSLSVAQEKEKKPATPKSKKSEEKSSSDQSIANDN